MQSGCPYSQEGAYPAFHHQSNLCVLTSPQDRNVPPVPGVQLAIGKQHNMVATLDPAELREATRPAQWQQCHTQSQQSVKGLHQLEPQPSSARNGFYHQKPRYSVWISQNDDQQVSRKSNTARQSGFNSGELRDCSMQKGSNLNIDTGLQQRLKLNVAFSDGTSSATLQGVPGDSLEVAPQTFPSQIQYSQSERKNPLLVSLLTGSPPEVFATTPSSLSENPNARTGPKASNCFSNQRHHQSQEEKKLRTSLDCGKTRPQNLDQSGRKHPTPWQQQVCSPPSSQSCPEKVLPIREIVPPTDDDIKAFVQKSVTDFSTNRKNGHIHSDSTLQSVCMSKSNGTAHLPTTSVSGTDDMRLQILGCAVIEQGTTVVGKTLEEDSVNGSKAKAVFTPKSKEMSDCATSASKDHLTGTPASAVGNSKHAPKTESAESALIDLHFPINKKLDAPLSSNNSGKHINSSDCEDKEFADCNNESFRNFGFNKYLRNGGTTLHFSLTALKELIASLENVETIAEMDNCPNVILQRPWNGDIDNIHVFASTEHPDILGKVAATCMKKEGRKKEDEGPVVPNALPSVTLDELTLKHHSSSLNSKGDTDLKPLQAVWMGNVRGVTNISEDIQTKLSSMVTENDTFKPTTLIENLEENINNIEYQQQFSATCKRDVAQQNSLTDIQIHNVVSMATNQNEHLCNQTSHKGQREDLCPVYPQTDVSEALNEDRLKRPTPISKGNHTEALCVRDPQYEDISDDEDLSQLAAKPPVLEHEDLGCLTSFEQPQFEDTSETENPTVENVTVGRCSLGQVPEPNSKQSSFEKEKYAHVQCQVLEDDEISNDWIVIPVCVSELNFEPEEEYCESPENAVQDDSEDEAEEIQFYTAPMHSKPHWPSPPHSSMIPVFDTVESFEQAHGELPVVALRYLTPEPGIDSDVEPNRTELDSEAEESSDTDDSLDYISGSGPNKLTASRQLWEKRSVTDDSGSEKEGGNSQTRSLDKTRVMQKPKQQMQALTGPRTVQIQTNEQKISKDNVIVISDTEDETDYNSKKQTESKKKKSSGIDNNEYSPEILGSGTVKNKIKRNRQHIEAKDASDDVQHNRQSNKSVTIIDSDDDTGLDYSMTKRKRLSPSGSTEGDFAPYVQQKTYSPLIVNIEHGPAKKKLRETRLPSADLSLPQHQSKCHYIQFKEILQDTGSDLTNTAEQSGQLVEVEGGSEHVQHRTITPKMSGQKRNTKKKHLIEPEDSSKATFSTGRRHSTDCHLKTDNNKPKIPRLSYKDSPKRQPRSLDKEADPPSGPDRLIPRLVAKKSPQSTKDLILFKESEACMQVSVETLTPKTLPRNSKKTDPCENNAWHSQRNEEVSKEKPDHDRNHSTNNNIQANTEKSRHSSPSQTSTSSSFCSSPFTRGHISGGQENPASSRGLSKSGESSATPSPPKSMQHTSFPRQHSSSSKHLLSRSHSHPPQLDHFRTSTKSPSSATMQLTSRKQLIKDWRASYYPTKFDRKCSQRLKEDFGTTRCDSRTESRPGPSHYEARPGPSHDEARPRPSHYGTRPRSLHHKAKPRSRHKRPRHHHHESTPRQRGNSLESAFPLLKKSKCDAVEWTKAINRGSPRKQSYTVPEGYKGSENPEGARPARGSKR